MGGWRRLHNDELHDLFASPNIIRVIESRKIKLAGLIARMAEMKNEYRILVRKPEGRRPLGRIRRGWEAQNYNGSWENRVGSCRKDASGSGQGPVGDCFEHSNEPSGLISSGDFLD
jgi:hypothetical protein